MKRKSLIVIVALLIIAIIILIFIGNSKKERAVIEIEPDLIDANRVLDMATIENSGLYFISEEDDIPDIFKRAEYEHPNTKFSISESDRLNDSITNSVYEEYKNSQKKDIYYDENGNEITFEEAVLQGNPEALEKLTNTVSSGENIAYESTEDFNIDEDTVIDDDLEGGEITETFPRIKEVKNEEGNGSLVEFTTGTNIRSGPGLSYSIVTVGKKKNIATFLGDAEEEGWIKIRLENGTEGYCKKSIVKVIESEG